MSTSYYIRRKPDKAKVEQLTKLMLEDDTLSKSACIQSLYDELYGDMRFNHDKGCLEGCETKIGRYTGGWKFLWHPLIFERITFSVGKRKTENGDVYYAEYDEPTYYCFWGKLTKEDITNVIMDGNHFIYDEYGQLQDKKDFLEMSMNTTQGYDDDSYFAEHPKERRYSDQIRTNMFIKAGYDVKYGTGDFYSDGMRFAVYDF